MAHGYVYNNKLTSTQLIILQSFQVFYISIKFMPSQLTTKVELLLGEVSSKFIPVFLWQSIFLHFFSLTVHVFGTEKGVSF